eukprot:10285386-Prorocentrum_lima.AAC.1
MPVPSQMVRRRGRAWARSKSLKSRTGSPLEDGLRERVEVCARIWIQPAGTTEVADAHCLLLLLAVGTGLQEQAKASLA